MPITNLFRRIVATLRRSRLDDELREELAQHVAWKTEGLVAGGMPEDEARRRAAIEMGNVTRLREQSRAVWGFPSLDSVAQDVDYALRQISFRAEGRGSGQRLGNIEAIDHHRITGRVEHVPVKRSVQLVARP